MDKKKAVKLATASAVAASAFVAANPHASQAATDVATVVSQAKAQMKEAYYTYSHTVTETGQFPDINDVYAAYNKAKQAYANAVAVVNKAGGAKKDAYLADLQATYETYVFKANPKSGEARVATYIDAYNYATKLDAMRQELKAAVEAKDLKKAEELYHKISYELKTRTVILDRVYGQSTRELLRSTFKADAQALRDSLIYDITVSIKAREAQDAVKAGNLDKAKAALDQVNQYVSKVTDAFKAELQKAAQDANAAYEAALTPKVESVSAINLNQILVTFNKELDKDSAENLANYTLNNGTVNAALNNAAWTESPKATLQADGKSVLITLDTDTDGTYQTLANQLEAKLTIDGVKTKDGKAIAKSEHKFTYTDTTVPTVESVKMEGNKVIVVKFSEAVRADQAIAVANYQIDGVSLSAYGVGTPQWDAEKNEVRIPLTTALADKTYKLKVSVNNGIQDVAGYKLLQVEKDLTVVTDKTVGKMTEVSVAADKSYVLVKFDKALAPSNYVTGQPLFIDGVNVFNSNTIARTIENGALKLTPAGGGTDFNTIIANGIHAVNLKSDDNNYLVDAYGIKVAAGATSYNVVADTTKPTVESVTVNEGATTIEVKFSESVDSATAQNRFNYTLKKADGSVVTISSATFKSGSTNTVQLTVSALDAGNYTLTVQNVKDRAGNTMDSYSKSLSVADLVAPTVTAVKQGIGANSNSIYVYFSEAVNTATATDVNNYLYNNKALPAGTSITALSASAVKITLPSSVTVTQGTPFAVSNNVTDVAGNKIAGYGYQTTVSGTVANDLGLASGTAVKVVDKRTVQVTLNKELKSVNTSDFEFKVSNGSGGTTWATVPQQNVSYVNSNGKATITFKFNSDVVDEDGKFATGATRTAIAVRTNQTSGYTFGTVAVDDTTFTSAALGGSSGTDAADNIAPTLASTNGIVTVDSNNNGKIDKIKLTFTEAINGNYLSATTFDVSGYTVTGAALDGLDPKVVWITVAEKSTPDTDATPNIVRLGTVKDANGNEFTGLTTASASVDQAAPVIVSAKYVDADGSTSVTAGDKVEITFSENVKLIGSATLADLTDDFVLSGSTSPSFGTGATFAINGNKVTVTLGTSPSLVVGTTTVELTSTSNNVSLEDYTGVDATVSSVAKTITN